MSPLLMDSTPMVISPPATTTALSTTFVSSTSALSIILNHRKFGAASRSFDDSQIIVARSP
jgi:hypothetical protein